MTETVALARARSNVLALASASSAEALLTEAAPRLGAGTGLWQLMISRLAGGVMTPLSAWHAQLGPHPAPEGQLALGAGLVETELAKRPGTTIVDAAMPGQRAPRALTDGPGWRAYVVARLTVAGRPIGFLHAEAPPGRPPDEVDRRVTELLSAGFATAFEVASLRQALAAHRDVRRAAIRQLTSELDGAGPSAAAPPAPGLRHRDPLTPREREVLALLARGLTNRTIAQQLVIGEATVKYHVGNLLRKLGATSRAEAVARHLRQARPADVA